MFAESSVFKQTWTKDMSSMQFMRPLNQIELTKNIRIDKNRLLYIRTSSIEFGHLTKWNCLQKLTNGRNPALKQPRQFEVLVPFTVFPYSELTINTDYFLWNVYQGKVLTRQVWKPKSSWTMTVRFCSRYPLGHRTHKNTVHTWKKFCVRRFRSAAL